MSNRAKHGIRFETAARVFSDPYADSEMDRIVDGEMRWQTTGLVDAVMILMVAHTWVEETDGSHIIRHLRPQGHAV